VLLKERFFIASVFSFSIACSGDGSGTNGAGTAATGTGGVAAPGVGGATSGSGGATGAAGTLGSGGSGTGGTTLGMGGSTGASAGGAAGAAGANGGASGSSAGASSTGGGGGASGGGGSSGSSGAAGAAGATGTGGSGPGMCCPDGKCLCHGDVPSALTSKAGPYMTKSYTISGTGCVFYPTNADPPFAAVTIADGFTGSGGCNSIQTGQWGPLYASWGIVAMIVDTGANDQPQVRGTALSKGIAAFKTENMNSMSPLSGKLAGRYGTSGFSMGGGGTTYSAKADPTLLSDVAIMAWGPVTSGITVPTLFICGSSDTLAGCSTMGTPAYAGIADTVPKMRVTINSGHAGQPSSGGGKSGEYGLAFQKVFLEGDTRWRPLLVAVMSDETNIK